MAAPSDCKRCQHARGSHDLQGDPSVGLAPTGECEEPGPTTEVEFCPCPGYEPTVDEPEGD